MKFNHVVKYNGVLYKAGEDVPMEQEKKPSAPSSSENVEDVPKKQTKKRGRPAKAKEQ